MAKRVFLVHGWDGHPENGWFPWLKAELLSHGFTVCAPQLPEADEPQIAKWLPALDELVGQIDEQTYFVGHSMGCQTIARLLAEKQNPLQAAGAIFVAGFFTSLSLPTDDARTRRVVNEWLYTPLDLARAKSHLGESVAIFSDDDPLVPITNSEAFEKQLGSTVIIETGKGHFSGSTGTFELPIVFEALLAMASHSKASTGS